jgi:hypothetical protein
MRIGKSFVDELTSRAVDTELGRGYRGMRFRRTNGEKGEDVRRRIERWKDMVERAQSITALISHSSKSWEVWRTEEYILHHNGLVRETDEVAVVLFVCFVSSSGLLLDSCPG